MSEIHHYHEMLTLLTSLSPFVCLAYMGFLIWGYPPPTPPWDLWPQSVDLTPLAKNIDYHIFKLMNIKNVTHIGWPFLLFYS